jgi:beta-glucuronidase
MPAAMDNQVQIPRISTGLNMSDWMRFRFRFKIRTNSSILQLIDEFKILVIFYAPSCLTEVGEVVSHNRKLSSQSRWSETSEGHAFVKEMFAYVKSLDPTRPVGFASNRMNSNPSQDATAYSDFVMMNQYWGGWAGPKQGLSGALDAIHVAWPDKTVIISEFGFEPNWNRLWGPATSTLNHDEYYFVPDGTAPDSELADEQRRLLIHDQMAVFRTKPFIAGAVFWTYQDYRTRSGFVMGVMDPERNKRPSWDVLREEFSPALFDSFALSPVVDGHRTMTITLHTRGPIDMDMPVYTLRGYTLQWALTSTEGSTEFFEGEASLPTLSPASQWSGEFTLEVPAMDYIVTVSIIRPTGFSVIECSINENGEQIP